MPVYPPVLTALLQIHLTSEIPSDLEGEIEGGEGPRALLMAQAADAT